MTVLDQIQAAGVQVAPELLSEAVGRIVAIADPERILVFGSAARGTMHRDSDVDLLIVKDGEYDRRRLTSLLYRALADLERDTDVILVTPADLARYKDSSCLVFYRASREGRVIYDRTALQR